MSYVDPSGFFVDFGCTFWCKAAIGTALNFLFGGHHHPPPLPKGCWAAAMGCYGAAASSKDWTVGADIVRLPVVDASSKALSSSDNSEFIQNSKSPLSVERQMEVFKAMKAVAKEISDTNVGTTAEAAARVFAQKVYPLTQKYDVEFHAVLKEVDGGWGITELKTDYLHSTVYPETNEGPSIHTHPSGGTLSSQDISTSIGVDGNLKDVYVARSSSSVDKFDYSEYKAAVDRLPTLEDRIAYRERTINLGGHVHAVGSDED